MEQIPVEFPLFHDWPIYKIQFMSNLSSIIPENEENIKPEQIIIQEEIEKKIVIATDKIYKYNESGKCYICNHNLNVTYDINLDEWVYPDCEVEDGKYVIHEICMFYK